MASTRNRSLTSGKGSLLPVLLLFPLIPLVIGCLNGETQSPPSAGKAGPEMRLAAGFFLYPAPELKGQRQEVMQDLLAAPLMNQDLILKMAIRFEQSSRQTIRNRRAALQKRFCGTPVTNRDGLLQIWQEQRRREQLLWLNTRDRFERALEFRLRKVLPEVRLQKARAARTLVIRLQEERMRIVDSFWERYLIALQEGDTAARLCSQGSGPVDDPPGRQHLNAPLYLARYQFYSLFEPAFRMRLILELHSGKRTDK